MKPVVCERVMLVWCFEYSWWMLDISNDDRQEEKKKKKKVR